MKTYTSFQFTNLVKSFTIFFFAITVLWAIGNYIAIRDVLVSWPIFAVNIVLAAGLGWWYYRNRFHTVFSYDGAGFDLHVGRQHVARRWDDFSTVSLYHRGYSEFTVRLYQEAGDAHVEIPASALKLNAQEFRFEVMELVRGEAEGQADS